MWEERKHNNWPLAEMEYQDGLGKPVRDEARQVGFFGSDDDEEKEPMSVGDVGKLTLAALAFYIISEYRDQKKLTEQHELDEKIGAAGERSF